jgi:hypothetical protein
VLQCDAEALIPCTPLIADAGTDCGAALKADAVNRQRMIECQIRQRAASACLLELERVGILSKRP